MTGLEKFISFLRRHFGPLRLFLVVAAWTFALGAWGMVARTDLPIEHRTRWEAPIELRAPLYAKFDSGWYLAIIESGYGKPPPDGRPSPGSARATRGLPSRFCCCSPAMILLAASARFVNWHWVA